MDKDTMTLPKEKALQIVACLDNSIYSTDEWLTIEQRRKLIDYTHDLMWDIAERYDLDLNEGYIHPETLEYVKF